MILIDAANVAGGGAVLLQCLLRQLDARNLPYFVLRKADVPLDVPADRCANVRVGLLNRRATLRAYIRAVGPTTILCFGNFPPPFATGIRTITYVHNPHYVRGHDRRNFNRQHDLNRVLRRTYLRANLKHSDWFVVQTPLVAQAFTATFGVPAGRVRVLPFYDEARIRFIGDEQRRAGVAKTPAAFLYASSSEPHKNHGALLRAWELLFAQGYAPTLHLTVSPRSPYTTPALLAEIDRLQRHGLRIENHGQLPYDDLLRLAYRCAACVFPSVNETLGLGLVEAYWLGNGILAGRRPYLPHVVRPSAGFDPHDPADIARAVRRHLTEPGPAPALVLPNRLDAFVGLLSGTDTGGAAPDPPAAVRFHDQIARRFDRKYELSPAFGERFRVWTTLFDRYVRPGDRVLDLGCGSGVFSRYLAGRGCQVVGIDGSPAMIALGEQKAAPAHPVRYLVQTLPLANLTDVGTQDVIVASSLLEYMDDMDALLGQARLLLRPGGLLIASVPNNVSLYRRIERRVFRLTGRPAYFGHIRNVSNAPAFTRRLARIGFSALETHYFSSYDPLSRLLKPFLAESYVNNLLVGVYQKQ